MHLFLTDHESEPHLIAELARSYPECRPGAEVPGAVRADLPAGEVPTAVAFSRQCLPDAREVRAASVREWSTALLESVAGVLPDDQPWRLHILPRYGSGKAGENRCGFIRAALDEQLQKKRRHLRRMLEDRVSPFTGATSVVQLILGSEERGWISVCRAPEAHAMRALVSSFPGGEVPVAVDKSAPSRAFAKLVEAEHRLGTYIAPRDTCVDLGACPGSWSYVAIHRGAHVTAVDRSPLRDDLMQHQRLTFVQGDAFTYTPPRPVDWLVCDVIAAPERSIALAIDWAQRRLTRHFVVTIKFRGETEYPKLDALKTVLAPLCSEFRLARLCANKNEACVSGTVRPA